MSSTSAIPPPGVAMYDTAFMYMIGDNDNNRWGTVPASRSLSPAYRAKKTAGSYEAYNAAMKELQALADEQVVGLALCWDKATSPTVPTTMRAGPISPAGA